MLTLVGGDFARSFTKITLSKLTLSVLLTATSVVAYADVDTNNLCEGVEARQEARQQEIAAFIQAQSGGGVSVAEAYNKLPARLKSKWELVWNDEFNQVGSVDEKKWYVYNTNQDPGTGEIQANTGRPENLRVENGKLIIQAHREDHWERQYTSARVSSAPTGGFTYGRFEFRAKLPVAMGTWPALWFFPAKDRQEYDGGVWPRSGEIDLVEHVVHMKNKILHVTHTEGYNHWKYNMRSAQTEIENVGDWNTYALEWAPNSLKFFVNGKLGYELKNDGTGWQSWPFNHAFVIIMNVAIGGFGGTPDEAAFLDKENPVQMEVDYVRVYRPVDKSHCQ